MDLLEFKKQEKLNKLDITSKFGKILTLVDFGNVDYWFEKDRFDQNNNALKIDEKLNININKLYNFCQIFSTKAKFYYGLDSRKPRSIYIIKVARENFGKLNVATKEIQYIRHYLSDVEKWVNTRSITSDGQGDYVLIPKCNFDVEICIDAIKLIDQYDTLCLFSGDADFVSLFKFIKTKGKKIILIKSGYVATKLIQQADLVINAQDIKADLVFIKQKSRL